MKVLDIALKDFTRSMRSAIGLAFMFVIPMMVTGMFYFMFGASVSSGQFELARIKVVTANLDLDAPKIRMGSARVPGGIHANTMSDLIIQVLQSEDLANLLEVTVVEDAAVAKAAVDSQQAQVAVIIPAGFSRQFADPNAQAHIEFYQDPTLNIGPGVVKAILNQFMDSMAGVKITVDVALDQLPPENYALVDPILQEYLRTSLTQEEDLSGELLDISLPAKTAPPPSENAVGRIVGFIMSGMLIFYAFYTGTASAESLLREEEEGTLPRLFTTPTPQVAILSGKFLSVLLTVFVQVLVLLVASHFIFKIQWGEAQKVALSAASTILCATSFGVFINSFLKNTKQGGVVFGGVLTVTGMLGMVSIFAMGSPSGERMGNTVALLVPQGWAIRGLTLAMNGQPLENILLNSLALLAWAAVFFAVGVWRFNHRYS